MRRMTFLVAAFLCIGTGLRAQHYQKWMFGTGNGMDFRTDPPIPYKEGSPKATFPLISTSVCDKDGKLVFYTKGDTVWNAKGNPLLRHKYRWPWSGRMAPLLLPVPGNDTLYYLFGISEETFRHKLQYLLLNSKANRREGEIVYPQPSTTTNYFVRLMDSASVMLAATLHCNRKDTWVVSYYDRNLYAFLVSDTGVSRTPVVSPLPAGMVADPIYEQGQMKFSGSGEKLLMPMVSNGAVLVAEFNDLTGAFQNYLSIPLPAEQHFEDGELSPDGSKLYIGSYDLPRRETKRHDIFQMDLRSGEVSAITASWTRISNVSDMTYCSPRSCLITNRTMAAAPDGRIYISGEVKQEKLSVIEDPNLPGLLCNYRRNNFRLGSTGINILYNYVRSASFTPNQNGIQAKRSICRNQPFTFSLLYKNVDSVRWHFADPPSGAANISNPAEPPHQFTDTGNFRIQAIIYRRCYTDTAFYEIKVTSDEVVKIPEILKDTLLCVGQELEADATTAGATSYLWTDTDRNSPLRTITTAGTYQVIIRNSCSLLNHSFTVAFENCPCNWYLPNAFSPNNDGSNDSFGPVTECVVSAYEMVIFNRYGQQVFTTRQPSSKWDGRVGNNPQPEGMYPYTLQYLDPNTRKTVKRKGMVLLLR